MEAQALSLYELNGLIKRSIRSCMPDTYWVQAELSDVRSNYSGHCYLEFVQKDAAGNNLIAKARGTIWSNIYKMLKPYFEQETGQTFTEFLTAQRMQHAKMLLDIPKMRVSDAAEKCGYADSRYFSVCFKKHWRMTPSEYQESLSEIP